MAGVKYRLFLVDLDGTLLGSDGHISPRVAQAVRTVAERVQTSIATGRERDDVMRFAGELGLKAPQISDNGAMVLDPVSGTCLWCAPLPQPHAQEVLARLDGLGMEFIATDETGTMTSLAQAEGRTLNRVSAMDLSQRAADDVVAGYASVAALDAMKVFLPYNGLWAVDFTATGVNKGMAARKLADLAGMESSQVIAAGDSYNDLPLLEASGLGIAMGDAPDELKSMADYVAPGVDDDGLAVAIEEFVLPRL